jgi:hypothetical protein
MRIFTLADSGGHWIRTRKFRFITASTLSFHRLCFSANCHLNWSCTLFWGAEKIPVWNHCLPLGIRGNFWFRAVAGGFYLAFLRGIDMVLIVAGFPVAVIDNRLSVGRVLKLWEH